MMRLFFCGVFFFVFILWTAFPALGRQSIFIGEISMGYDFQERSYDEEDAVAQRNSAQEDRRGDSRSWFVSPRMRFSSQGGADLFELTYAPVLTYDDLHDENEVDHSLNLLMTRKVNQNWLMRMTDNFYYGEDPVADDVLRTTVITPSDNNVTENVVVRDTETGAISLVRTFGRTRYWRNDLSLYTAYEYAQDSQVALGYNLGVLRNIDGTGDNYTDYDRHEGILGYSYRFSPSWRVETEGRYVKGIYDDNELPNGTEENSDDLQEFHGLLRADYRWRPHDLFFGSYRYAGVNYDSDLSEDSIIHEISLGWEHDFNRQLRIRVSAGPTSIKYDNSPSLTDYNYSSTLTWKNQRSHAYLSGERGFSYENFNGKRDGLTKFWRVQTAYSYQFTPAFNGEFSAGYTNNDRDQLPFGGRNLFWQNADLAYTEDLYDVGATIKYNFLRWYTFSLSYRYANTRSGAEQDYDEHRFFVTLSGAKEFFRW